MIYLTMVFLAVASLALALKFRKSDEFLSEPAPSIESKPRIVIIGNSITLHGPKPTSGWFGNQGMAASNIDHDFAHVLIARLGIDRRDAYIRNFYPFETSNEGAKENIESLSGVLDTHPPITVLELGDNTKFYKAFDFYHFSTNYHELVTRVAKSSGHVYCISTYWRSRLIDWTIKSACKKYGGTYVDIGDIYNAPGNPDRLTTNFPDPGVDKHPKDHGMQEIAIRLERAITRTGASATGESTAATAQSQ